MAEYRLLIDIEVVEFLRSRSRSQQELLMARFRTMASSPSRFYDYTESDAVGRALGMHVFASCAIQFWEDPADMHLKILDIYPAD